MKRVFLLLVIFSFLSCGSSKSINASSTTKKDIRVGNIEFSGGDGSSMKDAIVILNAKGSRDGIAAEYAYIDKMFGRRSADWIFISQALRSEKGKSYDVITFELANTKEEKILYFDISDFFGKF